MQTKSGLRAVLLLIGIALLLGGTVAPVQAQTLEVQLLTTNKGCGAGATFVPGEVVRIFLRASHQSRAVLVLERPGSADQTLVDQTIAGGITYFLDRIVSSDLGGRTLTLTLTADGMTDTETCTYSAAGDGSGDPVEIALLTTSKGCGDAVTYAPGEFIRIFFRVSRTAHVVLKLQRPGDTADTAQTIVDQTVSGGVTYFLDRVVGPEAGVRTLILTATAGGVTDTETCTYNGSGDGGGAGLEIQLLTTNKGCGASFRVGEGIRIFMRVSRTAIVTLDNRRLDPSEDWEPILTNVVLQGGVTYFFDGAIGPRTGPWELRLRGTTDSLADEERCAFTVTPS